MAAAVRAQGLATTVRAITEADPGKEVGDGPDALLGILMPTHGFTAPWLMLKSVWRLPRRKGTHAFCVTTRGGLKFGSLFTPGLGGTAVFIVALILAFKGYRLRGGLGLDMPSNWMALHPGLHPDKVEPIVGRGQRTATGFIEKIVGGKVVWLTWNNLYDFLFGVLLIPVSFAYLCVGRVLLAKLFFANNKCNSCGICVSSCPIGAVKLKGSKERPFWAYNCESCMRCMAYCPTKAVEVSHAYAALLIWAATYPVAVCGMDYVASSWPSLAVIDCYPVRKIISWAVWLTVIIVSYYLFHFLQSFRPLNALFRFTTFTALYRRYHEPGTKLSRLVSNRNDTEEDGEGATHQ